LLEWKRRLDKKAIKTSSIQSASLTCMFMQIESDAPANRKLN
jgi:hypothetical protein